MSTTTEKEIQAAAGLGSADPSEVLYGVTFTSETGIKQTGTYIPSADHTKYDDTNTQLGADTTQTAIEALTELQRDTAAAAATTKTSLESHTSNKSNPHGVTKDQLGLGNVNNTADASKPVSTAQKAAIDAVQTNLDTHTANTSNPHGVTKAQVGLSNVPNVATNDQTPTYTAASSNAALTSGEKLSVAMGKIAKAISSLISHLANTSNPHSVTAAQVGLGNVNNTADANKSVKYATSAGSATKATQDASGNVITSTYATAANLTAHTGNTSNPHSVTKAQVGLGNVPNVATNNQTPTYTAATSLTALTSGEKLSVAFGKLAKAVSDLISHLSNTGNPHSVTAAQVGLGNVDNTADANKSVKSATSATSATKAAQLTTARAIDGVSFNGTADITHFGTCSTAAATAAKTVALTGFTLVTGARIAVKFTITNTAAKPTLNVNSTGAKAIMYRGANITAGYLAANRVYEFVYDGTDWELVGDINTNISVVNNLTSTSTTAALSANQGKALNDKLGTQVTYSLDGNTLTITTK